MSQFMNLPLWLRFEPVLRFDCEGLLALPVPTRSEAFAEDLDGYAPQWRASTPSPGGCEDSRSGPMEQAAEQPA